MNIRDISIVEGGRYTTHFHKNKNITQDWQYLYWGGNILIFTYCKKCGLLTFLKSSLEDLLNKTQKRR